MYKLSFFVPPSHVEQVKSAVFAAGGGRIGAYDQCAWQVLGQGQFRPWMAASHSSGRPAWWSGWRNGKSSWWWPMN